MIRALYTAATGMNAQQTMVDTSSNNLANVNTVSFKRMIPQFQDLIYLSDRIPGSIALQGRPLPDGLQIGHGVAVSSNEKVFNSGTLNNTGNPYDGAIDGDGFFQVTMPNGMLYYTRAGKFAINNSGNLVTSDGFLLNPQISIPQNATSVSIGTDGSVSVVTPGSTTPTQVGQLQLVRFQDPAGLSNEGRNLYMQTLASGSPVQTQAKAPAWDWPPSMASSSNPAAASTYTASSAAAPHSRSICRAPRKPQRLRGARTQHRSPRLARRDKRPC